MYVLAERGVVGVVLFLMLWVVALSGMLRFLRRSTDPARADEPSDASMLDWGLLALLVALLAHATIDSTLHWLPVAVTAHLALGLVPVPGLRMRTPQRTATVALAALAAAYAVTVMIKSTRDYPAYRQWQHASMGEGEDPLGALLAARQRLPGEAKLDVHIGLALVDAGMPDSATRHLERAILEHDDLETRLTLAQAYHDTGRPAEALVHARAAIASFPDRLRPQLLLARIHHAAGDHAQARAALARCIERRTHYDTAAVDSVAAEAARLWRSFYADEPPG
jgi:tetratricopeptide (TPR) repeat protein